MQKIKKWPDQGFRKTKYLQKTGFFKDFQSFANISIIEKLFTNLRQSENTIPTWQLSLSSTFETSNYFQCSVWRKLKTDTTKEDT